MISIGELLMKYKRVDMYLVASFLGISPSYAYQLMKMFVNNPMAHKHFAERGYRIVFDGGELRIERLEALKTLPEILGEGVMELSLIHI